MLRLNLSRSAVEHSFLAPDSGGTSRQVETPVTSIESYMSAHGLDRIDFAKIEAEGLEPEIVRGIGEAPVRKIAIDVNAERNQKSPADEISAILHDCGYELQRRQNVLFAFRPQARPGLTLLRSSSTTGSRAPAEFAAAPTSGDATGPLSGASPEGSSPILAIARPGECGACREAPRSISTRISAPSRSRASTATAIL